MVELRVEESLKAVTGEGPRKGGVWLEWALRKVPFGMMSDGERDVDACLRDDLLHILLGSLY